MVTQVDVANWVASMGADLSYNTINGYRSAVSKWIRDETLCEAGNPANRPAVELVLQGIKRAQAPARARERLAGGRPTPLTPKLLEAMRSTLRPPGATPQQLMEWAALTLGVHGLLRPSEFLGRYKHMDRALVRDQCFFYDALGRGMELSSPLTPASLQVDLLITKADQSGANPRVVIDSARAVADVWEWVQFKRPWFAETPGVFHITGRSALSVAQLQRTLEAAARSLHLTGVHFTGRSLRRGGATGALLAGETAAQVQGRGRWRTARMVGVYTDSRDFNELAAVMAATAAASASAASR